MGQPIMSYADIAAKGPKQSPEEARAHPVPALEPSESESASLIDVDSPHVSSVKSDFQEQEVKTETQAERMEHEAEDKARADAQKASEAAESAKKKAATKSKEVKDALKKDGQKLSENRDNPVVVGNALIWGITAVALVDYFGSKWLLENKYPPK